MANLYLESFDHFDTLPLLQQKGPWTGGSVIVAGRTGNGLQVTGTGATLTLAPSGNTRIVGAAYKCTAFANTVLQFQGVGFAPPGATLTHTGDGRLQIGYVTFSSPSTFVMAINQWYFFEFKEVLTFDPGPPPTLTGVFTARANGQSILSHTNTMFTAFNDLPAAVFEGPGGGNNAVIDDVYYNDGTGAVNNDFMGDIIARSLFPLADGTFLAWTPSIGVNHFAVIDETPPNEDTDYLGSTSTPQSDSHTFGTVTHTNNIPLVQLVLRAKDETAGAQQIKHVYKKGAGLDIGSANILTSSYTFYKKVYETNPVTAVQWVGADITGGEFGLQRTV